MGKTRAAYPPEFRRQIVELVRTGRSPEELAREFEPTAQSIRNWVAQSARDGGRGDGGLTRLHVRANQGAAGIDAETIERFETKLGGNLYKLWNRMSSGSYFPPAVKAVPIPKKSGGIRILGVPTVADRVAQTAVKMSPAVSRDALKSVAADDQGMAPATEERQEHGRSIGYVRSDPEGLAKVLWPVFMDRRSNQCGAA
jgi:transposase-like protein